MRWTAERKREAAASAPCVRGLSRKDTRYVERPGWFQVITPSSPGYLNEIAFSKLTEGEAEEAIDEAIATYHPLGQPVKWYVGPSTEPADFGERLARRGFESSEGRAMGCAPSHLLEVPADVETFEIDASTLDDYVAKTNRGWGISPDHDAVEREAHHAVLTSQPRIVHFFGARIGAEWVGASAVVLRGDYGYLLGAQVFEPARGRGAYKALVAARLAFLRARGFEYAVTHAREATSAPILEHLGLETLFRTDCYLLPIARPGVSRT